MKQKSVALSTCEAEYMAANEAGKEAVWLRRLYMEDFGYKDLSIVTYGDLSEKEFEGGKPLTIFEDNAGCIALSRNPVQHKRSKHISIRWHWIRERVQSGELKLAKIDTKLNTADIFTKSTDNQTFTFLRDKLMAEREVVPVKTLRAEAQMAEAPRWRSWRGRPETDAQEQYGDPNVESKDSESLLVPRPDGQHKGSNDMARQLGMTAIDRIDAMDIAKTDMDREYRIALKSVTSLQHQLKLTIQAWGAGIGCAYHKEWNGLLQTANYLEVRLKELHMAECLATFAMRTQDAARYMAMDTEVDVATLDDWSGQFHSRGTPAKVPDKVRDIEDICGPAGAKPGDISI